MAAAPRRWTPRRSPRRARGARPPFQAAACSRRWRKDHDGSILDNLAGHLGGTAQLIPRTANGAEILDHVLGDKQETLARGISAKSGLDIGSVANLLTLRAPIVLGVLGKK